MPMNLEKLKPRKAPTPYPNVTSPLMTPPDELLTSNFENVGINRTPTTALCANILSGILNKNAVKVQKVNNFILKLNINLRLILIRIQSSYSILIYNYIWLT